MGLSPKTDVAYLNILSECVQGKNCLDAFSHKLIYSAEGRSMWSHFKNILNVRKLYHCAELEQDDC